MNLSATFGLSWLPAVQADSLLARVRQGDGAAATALMGLAFRVSTPFPAPLEAMFSTVRRWQAARVWDCVARGWAWLPMECRDRAKSFACPDLERAASDLPQEWGLSLARLVKDLVMPRLAPRLAGLLENASADVLAAAEEAFGMLMDAEPGMSAQDRDDLRGAVVTALIAWPTHRRPAILEAAIRLLDPPALAWGGSSLARWFADPDQAGHAAMRSRLKRVDGPEVRLRAWNWLGRDEAGAAALDRVGRASSDAEHIAVLEMAHLAENPRRRRRAGLLGGVASRYGAAPQAERVPALSVPARRGLARYLTAMRVDEACLSTVVGEQLADPDPAARHAAARRLPALRAVDFCFDADARVAGTAVARAVAEGTLLREQWCALERSAHPMVRDWACQEASAREPWGSSAWFAARRALTQDRDGFLMELRARLRRADGAMGAMMLARRLRLQGEVELELLLAARGGVEHEVATAIAALGETGTDTALAAVRMSLGHASGRVRANAVEALSRRPGESQWRELKSDPSHRVRANALLAIVRGGDGADELEGMLGDARPLHRLAGLWAVERAALGIGPGGRWDAWVGRVAELARQEPEPPVRMRAAWCAARMLARMRLGWEARAVPV